ncbi:protein-tyrosine phosphatase [Strigomonas culicis]|uniref:Protein-tyrosine phosphatase n=1 Tax=Strigomonas culicis TaxID=28005 RepID=S9UXC5_9TRYP|nr:protein-tyrosine phosphatase [Strigomonas culicis]EPY36923.1 protein-tyrosine phosphatase [Strigomonas culicis]|eukprot:EPY33518.1 protein-tyrosine phosphatase [Strigomonas culicis]
MLNEVQKMRHVALKGTTNLRNVGGYSAENGKTTKWGVLYRSDQLAEVPVEDAKRILIEKIHVHSTFDLRSPQEVKVKNYSIENVKRHDVGINTTHMEDWCRAGKPFTAEITHNLFLEIYTAFVLEHAKTFGNIVKTIVDIKPSSENAVLVHCTAGKDRTGITIYLILRLVGVNEKDIHADYLLTNTYFKQPHDADAYLGGLGMDQASMHVLWTVNPLFLTTAEKTIQSVGGLDAYAKEYMGLTAEDLNCLKEILLE